MKNNYIKTRTEKDSHSPKVELTYKNGEFTVKAGEGYHKGKEYISKIVNEIANGKKEESNSKNLNGVVSKDGLKVSSETKKSTTYSGNAQIGNNKIQGSAGKTETKIAIVSK